MLFHVIILIVYNFALLVVDLFQKMTLPGLHMFPQNSSIESFSSVKYTMYIITKTCLYNFDPLKPHFYIVKLGFTGVYIIFLISAENIDYGYLVEPPRRGRSNEYPQSMFSAET